MNNLKQVYDYKFLNEINRGGSYGVVCGACNSQTAAIDLHQLIHFESRQVYDYEILHKINRGSYGVVYKARNNYTAEIVAMKKLQEYNYRHSQEIEILQSLPRHPSIVKFNEALVDKHGGVFIVMEYLETDLQKFMSVKRGGLTASEIKSVMKQILEGVNFLHKQGIMHRDLKPSNLLINDDGGLKICDFGLACYFGSEPKSCGVGTRWYKAPELLSGDTSYSCAIDMWSVGCIMAELITKDAIFKGTSDVDQLQWIDLYDMVGESVLNLRPTFYMSSAYDLLEGLLAVDARKRITSQDALNHKWFKEGN